MTDNDVRNNISELGDDREMQRLIRMASSLANDNMKRKDSKQQTSLVLDNISKTIDETSQKIDHVTHVNPATQVNPTTRVDTTDAVNTANSPNAPDTSDKLVVPASASGIQLFNIFGFSLPKSTLYFILVAIAIAVILYYWTSPPSHQLHTDSKDDDETE